MKIYQWTAVLFSIISFGNAYPNNNNFEKLQAVPIEHLQMPRCLADQMPQKYSVLAENKVFKILEVPPTEMDNIAKIADKVHCGRFLNVSDQINPSSPIDSRKLKASLILLHSSKALVPVKESFSITHQDQVNEALKKIKLENLQSSIIKLSDFYNRASTEQTGVDAQNWIETTFQSMVEKSQRLDTELRVVNTGQNYKQKSVVAVIGKNLKTSAIVIGAHMDTLSGKMPGADDDATGSATVMEIARILLESNFTLKRPVYFVWYAAEEKGLVGSQRVVNYFTNKRIPVKAVLQLDMTGYRPNIQDPKMWVITDFTNPYLTQFIEKLIGDYIGVAVGKTQCGYACSDHASWTKRGISAAFPAETRFEESNPSIHSANDTIELLSTEHIVNYTKLGLAFAIELAA